jgi:hypothetical protein
MNSSMAAEVSSPEESHARALAEPDVNLCAHRLPSSSRKLEARTPMREEVRACLRDAQDPLNGTAFVVS